jgi:hypothetical protein
MCIVYDGKADFLRKLCADFVQGSTSIQITAGWVELGVLKEYCRPQVLFAKETDHDEI